MEKPWITQILEWVERVLPGLLTAFGLGYKLGDEGKRQVRAELDKTKTELELKNNELQNEKDFSGKSSDDVIDEYFGNGIGPKKPSSGEKG